MDFDAPKGKTRLDYSNFKTDISKRRQPAITRELTKLAYTAPKGTVSLAEGMPNEETFPFVEISIKLLDGSTLNLQGKELSAALQYIPSRGYPQLLQALKEFQRKAHSPPLWESREVIIVTGSQDGLSKTLEAIVGPGDPILVHDPYYPGVDIVVGPHLAEMVPVAQDEQGVDPENLREVLKNRKLSGKKMPKIMYINATGTNPNGVVIPLERRKEIYRIACEYDFLILDDDPYHFIYFTEEAPVSFLSLDTESRVIRLDSFSKVISSGMRIGFVTAPASLAAGVELHMQSSHIHAPTLSQVILYKLFQIWGYDGMMNHFHKIRYFYMERRRITVKLAKKHLNGLVDFALPQAGFFLWLKVRGVQDTWKMVMQRGPSHGVIAAPGAAFMKDSSKPCNAIRASFSKATYEEIDLAMERLADLIREELAKNRPIVYSNGVRNRSQVEVV